MGKCYCDYCDVFLTNDSVAVRKQHNDGNRHKYNVCEYYRQYVGQQLQEQIDEIVTQFQLKVAQGLIRPTYGLPPPTVKSVPNENKPNSEKISSGEKETQPTQENKQLASANPTPQANNGDTTTTKEASEDQPGSPNVKAEQSIEIVPQMNVPAADMNALRPTIQPTSS